MSPRDRIVGLRRVQASDLLEHPRRWRRHPESQRHALIELLERVGYADAVIARQTPDGLVLIDGHLRRDLHPRAELPVLVLDVSEEEADLVLASLDPLAAMAVPDHEALAELVALVQVPDGLLEHLSRSLGDGAKAGRTHPDHVPRRRARGRVRRGQLWALGEHRMLCGDAREGAHLARLMGSDCASVLWTDPPYGVSYVGKTAEALTIAGDDRAGLAELLEGAFGAADAVLFPGARLYVCGPAGPISVVFAQAFVSGGWQLRQWLVWVKDRMVLGHADYHFRHEPLLYGYRPGPGRWGRGAQGWFGDNAQDSVLEVPRPASSRDHPTAKPTELIRRCLANSSKLGDLVLDTFAGSGSTLIACEQLARRARVLEIDPVYCDVIVRRFEAFTGTRAEAIDG